MSKELNNTDSQGDVISTVTRSLQSFEALVRKEMPEQSVIYDEELSYETAIKQLLSNDNYSGSSRDPLPVFIYNRTVLIDSEMGIGKRAKNMVGCMRTEAGDALTYGATFGEYEIQFLYVSKSTRLMEQFEVVYNSDEGITGTKELIVSMGELGEFKYYLTYQELTSKEIVHENVYYKGIIGSIKVRGFYFTFRATKPVIELINSTIATRLPDGTEGEELGKGII